MMKNELKTELRELKDRLYNSCFKVTIILTFLFSIVCFGFSYTFMKNLSSDVFMEVISNDSGLILNIFLASYIFIFAFPILSEFVLMIMDIVRFFKKFRQRKEDAE